MWNLIGLWAGGVLTGFSLGWLVSLIRQRALSR